MAQDTQKIWSLYRITNLINNKNYIGQTIAPRQRWYDHKQASNNNPTQIIHYAIKKYGLDNFEFEVIASCLSQDDANFIETELVSQYDSFITNGKGYNVTLGGMNAPKTDVWKQSMRDWHASLSLEEKKIRNDRLSEATINQIATKGHPAQGRKWTDEQKSNLSISLKSLDKDKIYTEEVRQRMSEAHKGIKQSEELIGKRVASIKVAIDARHNKLIESGELRCNATNCNVNGVTEYIYYNNIRYCTLHGQRLKRTGSLELLPHVYKPMSEERKKKCGLTNIGKIPHNKIIFTDEQISLILLDSRSSKLIAKDFNVNKKIIQKIKRQFKDKH